MAKDLRFKRIGPVLCCDHGQEEWTFSLGDGNDWRWHKRGRQLMRNHELVFVGLNSLQRCIDFAHGYGQAVADALREERMKYKKDGEPAEDSPFLHFPTGLEEPQ